MELLSAVFIISIGLVLFLVCFWTLKNGISPMPTSTKVKRVLFEALPKHLEGEIVELGSGWGTLCFPLAKRYPNCRVIGYETSIIPYVVSQLVQLFLKQKNLKFIRKDFFKVPLSHATVAN